LGLIPVNKDFEQSKNGVVIYVISNGVHTEIGIPVKKISSDNFFRNLPIKNYQYVSFGQGQNEFYLTTPEWKDLKISLTLKTIIIPSATIMHLTFYPFKPEIGKNVKMVKISEVEFSMLVIYINRSFQKDRKNQPIPAVYQGKKYEGYYESEDSYHIFHTCNNWTNIALKQSGIRNPVWSPFDKAILYHLD
jgi:uncharacterized protein (TIGR02117 family)